MSTSTTTVAIRREPELLGQTVVVIGGSAGIGLETARRARAEGATLILAARNRERLQQVARELNTQSTVAFDATDFDRLAQFFEELATPIEPLASLSYWGPGRPYYAPLAEFDFEKAHRDVEAHLFLPLHVARHAANKVRPGGTLSSSWEALVARRPAKGFALISALTLCAAPPSQPAWRSRSRPSGSTSSPPASSTHRCRNRSSATSSTAAAISFALRSPSSASFHRPTSPRSPYTS